MIKQVCGKPQVGRTATVFPCGLSIPAPLAASLSVGQVDNFDTVHERHHLSGHKADSWTIKITRYNDYEVHECEHD